jgi:2-succinyl-6-hydroxy-2,4-cyclohexadiene-1-carboxylate synthase
VTCAVLLHGFTGSPESFDELASRLRASVPRLRLHRPALLGHGVSVAPQVLRFEQEVERLAAGIRDAGFAGAHLCGYSLGARVALGLLSRHPSLFRSATLIGVHPGLGSLAERSARVGADERWCELLMRAGLLGFLRAWEAQPIFGGQELLPDTLRARQRAIRSQHRAEGLARSLRVLGLGQMPDYHGVFAMQPLRVRLLVGANDTRFLRVARQLGAADRRLSLEIAEGVGHNLLLEAPALVARVLSQAVAA